MARGSQQNSGLDFPETQTQGSAEGAGTILSDEIGSNFNLVVWVQTAYMQISAAGRKKKSLPRRCSQPLPTSLCLKSLVWPCFCCIHKHLIIISLILTNPQEAENHSRVIFADGCDVPLSQAFGPSQQCQAGRGKDWYPPHWDAAASPHQSLCSQQAKPILSP